MSGLEVIGAASAIVALLEAAKKVYGVFGAVSEAHAAYHDIAKHILQTVELLQKLDQDRRNVLVAPDLREFLTQTAFELESVFRKATKILESKTQLKIVGITLARPSVFSYRKLAVLKNLLVRIDKKIDRSYQLFLASSAARVELDVLEMRQMNVTSFKETQDVLRDIRAHVQKLVSDARDDPSKAAKIVGLGHKTVSQMKAALRDASMDLGRDSTAKEDYEYLRLKVGVLQTALRDLPALEENTPDTDDTLKNVLNDLFDNEPSGGDGASHRRDSPDMWDSHSDVSDDDLSDMSDDPDDPDDSSNFNPSLGFERYPESKPWRHDDVPHYHAFDLKTIGDPTEDLEDAVLDTMRLTRRLLAPSTPQSLIEVRPALHRLGRALGELGLHPEASTVTGKAVEIAQLLSSDQSQPNSRLSFLPHLASSLHNLAIHKVHEHDQASALKHIERAVKIRRQLQNDYPGVFKSEFASSLNLLSNCLGLLSRPLEALANIKEAVAIRLKLACDNPEAPDPKLAISLNNMSNRLNDVGQYHGALQTAQEALCIYQKLANRHPAKFDPELAAALNNLANRLRTLGFRDKGIQCLGEAIKIRRRLAQNRPLVFNLSLANSLDNLAVHLVDVGDVHRSRQCTAEAAEIRYPDRQFLPRENDVHLPLPLPSRTHGVHALPSSLLSYGCWGSGGADVGGEPAGGVVAYPFTMDYNEPPTVQEGPVLRHIWATSDQLSSSSSSSSSVIPPLPRLAEDNKVFGYDTPSTSFVSARSFDYPSVGAYSPGPHAQQYSLPPSSVPVPPRSSSSAIASATDDGSRSPWLSASVASLPVTPPMQPSLPVVSLGYNFPIRGLEYLGLPSQPIHGTVRQPHLQNLFGSHPSYSHSPVAFDKSHSQPGSTLPPFRPGFQLEPTSVSKGVPEKQSQAPGRGGPSAMEELPFDIHFY